MTNEELMEQFMAGDESVLTKLCNKNEGLIRSRAKEIAQTYNCIQYTQRGKYKAYTKHILNDLCGVGRITFMDRIRSGKYDREKGMLTTFVVPFIDGDMRRYMEINLGNLALDRDDMTMVRKAQHLHHVEYMDAGESAAELNVSEEDAVRHIGYGTHFYGIDDLTGYYDDVDAYDYLLEDESTAPPKQVIYHRIRMEYFKELFDALPRRDKDILGKYYGVFGFRKEPMEDIAMYHFLTEEGVRESRDKALEKLRKAYPASMMRYWSKINRMLEYPDLLISETSEYD